MVYKTDVNNGFASHIGAQEFNLVAKRLHPTKHFSWHSAFDNYQYRSTEHECRTCQSEPDVMFLEDNRAENNTKEDAEPFYGYHVGGFGQRNGIPMTDRLQKEKSSRNQTFARLDCIRLEANFSQNQEQK